MSEQVTPSPLERRSFLSRISAGAAAFAGVMAGGAATGFAPSAAAATFQPELHEKDDWMDKIPGKHRVVFDTTTPDVLGDGLAFANNFGSSGFVVGEFREKWSPVPNRMPVDTAFGSDCHRRRCAKYGKVESCSSRLFQAPVETRVFPGFPQEQHFA